METDFTITNNLEREILTIRECVQRLRAEGVPVSESCLRRWVHEGTVPVRYAGRKALLYYPGLRAYVRGDKFSDWEKE